MKRLALVRHAPTASTRAAAFPRDDEGLDEAGRAAAASLAVPAHREALSSPAARCLETAQALGVAVVMEPALAECDFGAWVGRTLADLDPAAAGEWMTDPEAAPHGGESLRTFAARIGAWLDEQAASDGSVLAITHAGVVKAAIVHALDAPLHAFWQIDAAPLFVTELHAHDGRWTVRRLNAPDARRPTPDAPAPQAAAAELA
jgi:broad specificity phosphatase PhoE